MCATFGRSSPEKITIFSNTYLFFGTLGGVLEFFGNSPLAGMERRANSSFPWFECQKTSHKFVFRKYSEMYWSRTNITYSVIVVVLHQLTQLTDNQRKCKCQSTHSRNSLYPRFSIMKGQWQVNRTIQVLSRVICKH